jgi:1-acyl-sn-glycerol-3-phosphate acyltransferase
MLVRAAVHDVCLQPLVRSLLSTRSANVTEALRDLRPPVLFVANHASHLDTLLLLGALPPPWRRRTAVLAAADYWFSTWWRSVAVALLFNGIPHERDRAVRTYAAARALLADDWNLIVFPEGTRSHDGWMQRFGSGAARVAIDAQVPIVPVVVRGSFAAMPRGNRWPRRGRPGVSIRFGSPIVLSPGASARDLTRQMQEAVTYLWDEDESNWWQAVRRRARRTTPSRTSPPAARWRRIWAATRDEHA